jgi:hypothetical protein
MPTEAFIKAASAVNRQPVVLLAIESPAAEKPFVSIQLQWEACTRTNINSSLIDGQICITTDDNEEVAYKYSETIALNVTVPDGDRITGGSTAVFYSRARLTSFSCQCTIPYDCRTTAIILYGRLNGGAWQELSANRSLLINTKITLGKSGLTRGTWEFYVTAIYSIVGYGGTPKIISCLVEHETHYLSSATITTTPLDLGAIPTATSRFEVDSPNPPSGCSISYTAAGRNTDGAAWTSLGAITDITPLAPYRYYQITATLTSSSDGMQTPAISEIRIVGGDYQYTYLSTHKDTPMQGALPYIVPGGISSISSKIDLKQQATIGELTATLYWRKKVGDMIFGDFLKNKTITCKLGFVGLPEADYLPYFVGTWYDYQADQTNGKIIVKTRNILKRFTRKVPCPETFLVKDPVDDVWKRPATAKTYKLSGNIMRVMLEIIALLGIPGRLVNKDSFNDLESGARSGSTPPPILPATTPPQSDWYVSREISEQQDAMEMLNQLSVSSGVFLFEGADGRLTAKLYDQFAEAPAVATLDAHQYKFRTVDGGQKDLFTRQAIYYKLISGQSGGSVNDFAECKMFINNIAEAAWAETKDTIQTQEWKDLWGLSPTAIMLLGGRWESWFSVPRATVRVDDIPPRYYGIERGDIVLVNNLQLPCAEANWQGYTSGTRFLVMGKSGSDPTRDNLTISLDLMYIDDAIDFIVAPDFPDYTRLDYWPQVTELTVTERFDNSSGVTAGFVDVIFTQPLDFTTGSAVVWVRTNGGEWISYTVLPFGLENTIKRLTIPAKPGDNIEVRVSTSHANGNQMPITLAPSATVTVTTPNPDPSNLLTLVNPDIDNDKLAQYLLQNISLLDTIETFNGAVEPGALEDGCIATAAEILRSVSKQIILQAGEIGKQATQIELLNDRISLKLNSNGHVAGMAIGWDESGDISETIFLTDVFKLVLSNGGEPVQAFVDQIINGVPTLVLNGDLIVDGTLTGKTLRTAASGERFVVDAETNYAHFFDADNVERITIGAGLDPDLASTLISLEADANDLGMSIVGGKGALNLYSDSTTAPLLYLAGQSPKSSGYGWTRIYQGNAHIQFAPGRSVPDWDAAAGSLFMAGGWGNQLGYNDAELFFNINGTATGWLKVQLVAI